MKPIFINVCSQKISHYEYHFCAMPSDNISLTMREHSSDSTILTPAATGPAGPVPHLDYCAPQCYKKGKLSKSCKCKRCHGDAHGRGWKYAFEHGYLKCSPPGCRKPPFDQEELFPDACAENEL